mmetsp:Transcript_41110/g.93018  ORF Transcript_41110/g.93018 Transcript_41110/m.93018 type:complete len:103 (-) Transcript_41110:165-473(-)
MMARCIDALIFMAHSSWLTFLMLLRPCRLHLRNTTVRPGSLRSGSFLRFVKAQEAIRKELASSADSPRCLLAVNASQLPGHPLHMRETFSANLFRTRWPNGI